MSRALVTARKFDALGIAGEIPEPEQVATIPRLPASQLEVLELAGGLDDAA